MTLPSIVAVVPAAGIGSRMQSEIPKQYLLLNDKPVIEHTLSRLLAHQKIDRIVVALHANDSYFDKLTVSSHPKIQRLQGGDSRSDSVMNALQTLPSDTWALVHDAARPCVSQQDICALISAVNTSQADGAILATPVRDTMKRSDGDGNRITATVDREQLWHALTPQLFCASTLLHAYQQAQEQQFVVTDEASAMEFIGKHVQLVAGNPQNIKVTHPQDLALASFYLQQQEQA